jgi:hypothetical protein
VWNIGALMLGQAQNNSKKRFIVNSFVYLPISIALSITILLILARLFGISLTFGEVVFVITGTILTCVAIIINFYRKLSGEKKDQNY